VIDRLDPELAVELPIWRLLQEKVATLTELETTWSMDDVDRASALLEMKQDIMEVMMPKVKTPGR
jgi:ABC-type uncharacterized transport system substrate-binding protein